jgi:hypothetical protein
VPLRLGAQRVRVGGEELPVPFESGWILLNLDTTVLGSQVPFELLAQAFVLEVHGAKGNVGAGTPALQLNNATNP